MKSITKPIPVADKPHIVKLFPGRWLARCPRHYGGIRGYGHTPKAAYDDLLQRYAVWARRALHPNYGGGGDGDGLSHSG